jgi:hypothetical protein
MGELNLYVLHFRVLSFSPLGVIIQSQPITVNGAVIHGNRALLAKRDDFEVWCLPMVG